MRTNNKPKALHICKVFLPIKGGVQRVVFAITKILSGYQHTVVTTGPDGAIRRERIGNADVLRSYSYGEFASMPFAPRLISSVIKNARKHDLVVLHYPFPLADLALMFVPFAPPIIIHWHSEIVAQKKLKWLVAPFSYISLKRASHIIVTSDKMQTSSFWLRKFAHKVRHVPYGLPATPTEKPIDELTKPYFLAVGRHVSYKGFATLIRALKHCKENLVIAGNGPLLEQHRKLVKDLELSNRITFYPHANDKTVASLIVHSVALVLPSVMKNEAFALVQIEAMSAGKPIINTNLDSSVPWVARNMKEAITIQPGDESELAAAITRLAKEPEFAKELGENGLLRYKQLFTEDSFSKALDQIYTEATSR